MTGASFIVFSGAVKSSSPFMAKVSIVEGLSLVVCQSIMIFLSVQVGRGCFGKLF